MSARSFRSVGWVAGVAAPALGCYMVNLKVASERAALEDVETRIVLAERDIRLLQTEIGTRGRLAQLEKWNVKVLALSAPAANQFMDGSFQLATLVAPKEVLDPSAPVVLASAPAPQPQPVLSSDGAVAAPVELLHTASFRRVTPIVGQAVPAPKMKQAVRTPNPAPTREKKPVKLAQAEVKPAEAAVPAKTRAKAATAPVKTAAIASKPKPKAQATAAPKPKPKVAAKPAAAVSRPKAKVEAKTAGSAKSKPKVETKTAGAKPKPKAEAAAKTKPKVVTKTAAAKPKAKEAKARQ